MSYSTKQFELHTLSFVPSSLPYLSYVLNNDNFTSLDDLLTSTFRETETLNLDCLMISLLELKFSRDVIDNGFLNSEP